MFGCNMEYAVEVVVGVLHPRRVSYTREGELSLLHLFPHFKQLVHSSDSTLPSSTMYQTGVSRYFALLCVSCFFCGVEPVSAAFV